MTDIKQAYDLAVVAVTRRWAREHPDRLATLQSIGRGVVANLTGSYDHVENVLALLGVPSTQNPKRLDRYAIVFANCGMGRQGAGRIDQARRFVERGGHLVSSDWAMTELVSRAFPNTIARFGARNTGSEVVGVEAATHSLWAEVTVPGCEPQWHLNGSHPIEILDAERVTVEAASHELMCRYRQAPIAVRFEWEAGAVFHVISHFWLMNSRAPSADHRGPAVGFLKRGMRFDDAELPSIFEAAGVGSDALSFVAVQSAVTATELVARLCVDAVRAQCARGVTRRSLRARLGWGGAA